MRPMHRRASSSRPASRLDRSAEEEPLRRDGAPPRPPAAVVPLPWYEERRAMALLIVIRSRVSAAVAGFIY